jgi:hypothetical protein
MRQICAALAVAAHALAERCAEAGDVPDGRPMRQN